MVRYNWIIFILFFAYPLFNQEYNSNTTVLSRDAVPAVYQVDIRQNRLIFYTKQLEENELKLELAPGSYKYRVTFIDPFGKPTSESDWLPFKIRHDTVPYFRVIKPVTTWMNTATINLQIEGTGLESETRFELVNSVSSENCISVSEDTTETRKAKFEYYAGYAPMAAFITGKTDTQVVPCLLGLEFAVGFKSGLSKPFLRALGVEFHGVYGITGPNQEHGLADMMGTVDIAPIGGQNWGATLPLLFNSVLAICGLIL